jgi:hypothetical protein
MILDQEAAGEPADAGSHANHASGTFYLDKDAPEVETAGIAKRLTVGIV